MSKNLDVFAHRGGSQTAVENTMAVFEEARMIGATGVELDIQFSKDGIPVVFHDNTLYRMTGKRMAVNALTVQQLLALKQGGRLTRRFVGDRITTFKEVQEWAIQYAYPLNVELKKETLLQESALRALVREMVLPRGSHISTFSEEIVHIVHDERPDIDLALLVVKDTDWSTLHTLPIRYVHAHRKYYKDDLLNQAADASLGVRLYHITGDETYLARPHRAIIGYITDYPEKVGQRIL